MLQALCCLCSFRHLETGCVDDRLHSFDADIKCISCMQYWVVQEVCRKAVESCDIAVGVRTASVQAEGCEGMNWGTSGMVRDDALFGSRFGTRVVSIGVGDYQGVQFLEVIIRVVSRTRHCQLQDFSTGCSLYILASVELCCLKHCVGWCRN